MVRLEINSTGPAAMNSEVLIDGQKISGLQSVTLHMHWDDLSLATLTIGVDEVKIDMETLTKLEAHLEYEQRAAILRDRTHETFDERR